MSDAHMLPDTYLLPIVSGDLADDDEAQAVALAPSRVAMYRVFNAAGSDGDLYAVGAGPNGDVVATADNGITIAPGEDSGWIVANDKTLSLMHETAQALSYVIWVVGR